MIQQALTRIFALLIMGSIVFMMSCGDDEGVVMDDGSSYCESVSMKHDDLLQGDGGVPWIRCHGRSFSLNFRHEHPSSLFCKIREHACITLPKGCHYDYGKPSPLREI